MSVVIMPLDAAPVGFGAELCFREASCALRSENCAGDDPMAILVCWL